MDYFAIVLALAAIICALLAYYFWLKQPSERQRFMALQELMQFRAVVALYGKTAFFDILLAALEGTVVPTAKFQELLIKYGIQLDALSYPDRMLVKEAARLLDDGDYRKIVRQSKNLMEIYREAYREAKRRTP